MLAHPFTIENEDGTSIHYDDLIITKTRLVLEKDIYGITRGENTKWENAIENYNNYEEYRFELYMQINKSDYYKINLNFYSINNVTNTYFGRLEYDSYFKTSVDTRIIFYYNFEENEYILSFTEDRTKWYLEF